MRILTLHVRLMAMLVLMLLPAFAVAAEIDRFVGTYTGEAELVFDGARQRRDMSVTITSTKKGFFVSWTSVIHKGEGKIKQNTYTIEFVPSQRDHIYGSAMKTNMFGKQTPLDPLRGEPFVWSRFEGDTFSVFSLFINEDGDYELQEYHRTLADGGLDLLFRRVSNGVPQKEIQAFLKRD